MDYEKKIICPKCSKYISEENTNFCPFCGIELFINHYITCPFLSPEPQEKDLTSTSVDKQKELLLAGFWIRAAAFWLDALIILSTGIFLGSLVYSTAIGQQLFVNGQQIKLFSILLFIFYHGLSVGSCKTTMGKNFFGLEIVLKDRSKSLGYSEAFLRTLSYFFSWLFFCVGFLWIALDKDKQGFHDKIAHTLVIERLKVPLLKRATALTFITLFLIILIILQFNISWVYQSVFSPNHSLNYNRGKEVITILVTQSEIRDSISKEITTMAGPHIIKIPTSAKDGDIFIVKRSEEMGGIFYIKIVIVESV